MPFNTVQVGPIPNGEPTRWSPAFSATGLTFTGENGTYPTYNSYYVKNGYMVTFWIKVDLNTVTNFGTGQFKLELPFTPHLGTANHFPGWVWRDPSVPADQLNGHIILNVDHVSGDKTLDLHWVGATTADPKPVIEHLFYQGWPIELTTASKIYVNGTYFTQEL